MKFFAFLAVAVLCFSFAGSFASAQETCSLCQFAVQYIDGYLQQNYTQSQIIKQLEVVCALAPANFAQQCDAFVEQYVPVIIAYIVKYETPSTACSQLGLCSSFVAPAVVPALPVAPVVDLETFPTIVKDNVKTGGSDDCAMCKLLIGFVESYVAANQTITQIESYLGKICLLTPFSQACIQFVDTYTPIMVQYIQANEDPQTVCQQMGVCTSKRSLKFN